ncbi:galactose-binding like protein [Acaromyces ingoldii]|uniref:Galactose-binding like protein n=1 Tax=Acaromyces ingoldii TaxID=215250 RepID=A0A316YG31_9BASI|nr:galactose-binding like protein [Acaromyces ingoldii]PWN88169.1 galactose-binding like protein [Acaromyces ingoldii]
MANDGSRMFDVRVLSNKVDVGSQSGTLWSLSSQKPGYGVSQLRHADLDKLWQSDGTLPHVINIQFARRTAVTHVSMYIDHVKDDSYTPTKVRILAGTHYHDLVEVRTREFDQPQGWKHFVLDKKGNVSDSDESDGYTSSSGSSSSGSSFSSSSSSSSSPSSSSAAASSKPSSGTSDSGSARGSHATAERQHRAARRLQKRGAIDPAEPASQLAGHVAHGVSRRHPPIYTYYLQVCILANHSSGKDTHVRGLKVWGPPTKASRERVKRQRRRRRRARGKKRKGDEESEDDGNAAMRVGTAEDEEEGGRRKRKQEKRAQRAKARIMQWAEREAASASSTGMQVDGGDADEEDAEGWEVVPGPIRERVHDNGRGGADGGILRRAPMLR